MQEGNHFLCKAHNLQCMLFGSSSSCTQNSITCQNSDCFSSHSMKTQQHNFYSPFDFNKITAQLHRDYAKTVAAYKQNVNDIVKKAMLQLQNYKLRQFQLIQTSCQRIFSKNPDQSKAIAKVLKRSYNDLTCQQVAMLYQRYSSQKKALDYTAFQQVQMMVETTSVDICNNNNVFIFEDMRYSSAQNKRQSENHLLLQLKKKSYISPQDVQNQNVNLSLTLWDKMSVQAQQEVHKAVKNINWESDQWDLSQGGFDGLKKILDVSLMINSKDLRTFKLYFLVSNGLIDVKPLIKCRFNNLTYLYIAANNIVTLDDLHFTSFPNLKRLSAYDNDITTIRTLTKINYLSLKYLFLTNNHLNEFSDLRLCTFPKLTQLSLNSNPAVQMEHITSLDIPKMYYLNIKNKQSVSGPDGKYMFEQRLNKKFPFVIL